MSDYEGLTQLGHATRIPASPDEAVLERVPNRDHGRHYVVRFACPEFTSLCPMTGQPDFGHLVIDYVPGEWLVESKSLKLFLGAFRSVGIEPTQKRYLVLKSRIHYRAGFKPIARAVVECDGEGVTSSDYSLFRFRKLNRATYPLVPDAQP